MPHDRPWRRHHVPAARALRARQTPAEELLWAALRHRRFDGLKFRRQHPIGPFVVDFCCPDRRLVVELDGDVHSTQRDPDADRDALLAAVGYRTLRFPNHAVLNDLPAVLSAIRATANSQPPRPPPTSPQ